MTGTRAAEPNEKKPARISAVKIERSLARRCVQDLQSFGEVTAAAASHQLIWLEPSVKSLLEK